MMNLASESLLTVRSDNPSWHQYGPTLLSAADKFPSPLYILLPPAIRIFLHTATSVKFHFT
eukprot:142373-Hanusia_phi.AAC.1